MNYWENQEQKQIQRYNSSIRKQVYEYDEMQDSLARTISYLSNRKVDTLLEIGVGTGNLATALLKYNEIMKIYLVDINQGMINACKQNISPSGTAKENGVQVGYICMDIYQFDFSAIGQIDYIVSSITLHHGSYDDNLELYKKIYSALKPGGAFLNLDLIKSDNLAIDSILKSQYRDYLLKSMTEQETIETLNEYKKVDKPLSEQETLSQLNNAGFLTCDTLVKIFNFALFIALK